VNLTIDINPLANQLDSNFRAICFALLISLGLHFSVMRALPWLAVVNTQSPLTIIAEIETFTPPPPPITESKPVESPSKPDEAKSTQQPQRTPKSQAVATPILAAQHTEQASNYTVADVPKSATIPAQPSPVTAPETQSNETFAPATSIEPSSAASSPTSTSSWDDSDVWDEYGNSLQKLCERNKQYPAIAIRRGYQGSGKVLVRFSAEGKTTSITMEISTGQKSLDDQALEMVRKSLNELPVPTKFKGREFKLTIPVDFKLE
jgi:protein TonB